MNNGIITKEYIDNLFSQLAKEYKKLSGRRLPAEIIMIGGAAIVTQYGFRASTTDIDAYFLSSSTMKDAIRTVADRNGLPKDWINQDFTKTSSYSPKIREYSVHYKTFANILEVRILPPEYIVAMKLASLRKYRYDMSDIVGIICTESLSRDSINKAVVEMYGGYDKLSHPKSAEVLLDKIYSSDDLWKMYSDTRDSENENTTLLKSLKENYPTLLRQDNIENILESAKKARREKAEHHE